ncbi:MAG: carbohydrate ABC transporter permease [Planctomycetota bacterium]
MRRGREQLAGLTWISPWIVGFALFMLVPAGMSLYFSLTDYSLLEPPVFVGLDNFSELLGDEVVGIALWNTALYTVVAVPLGTVVAIAIALLLARPRRGIGLARAAVFLPTLVPLVAAALGWTWMYNAEHGAINALLAWVGITGPDWLGEGRWAMTALILMSAWSIGGAMVIYLAAIRDVPRQLDEAADLDGAGPLGRLVHVTLPMISPAILFNVVIGIIWSLQVFAVPYIMTRGGPDNATYFYTMYLFDNAFVFGRMGYACALGWLQLVVILIVTGLFLRGSRRFVFYRAA